MDVLHLHGHKLDYYIYTYICTTKNLIIYKFIYKELIVHIGYIILVIHVAIWILDKESSCIFIVT